MLFNIPQFIDKEDKIVGPLTAKQLGWMFAAGGTILVLWTMLDTAALMISSVFVVGIFCALAFYRPYNQTLLGFIVSSVRFTFRPKMYVWKRLPEIVKINKISKKAGPVKEKKIVDENKLEEISQLLDENSKDPRY